MHPRLLPPETILLYGVQADLGAAFLPSALCARTPALTGRGPTRLDKIVAGCRELGADGGSNVQDIRDRSAPRNGLPIPAKRRLGYPIRPGMKSMRQKG